MGGARESLPQPPIPLTNSPRLPSLLPSSASPLPSPARPAKRTAEREAGGACFYSSVFFLIPVIVGYPGASDSKESACNAGGLGLIPGLGRFPWRREWLPTPVFLPGKSHGQRSLADCGPWGLKESDVTKRFTFSLLSSPKVPLATLQRGFSETGPTCVRYQPRLEYKSHGCC